MFYHVTLAFDKDKMSTTNWYPGQTVLIINLSNWTRCSISTLIKHVVIFAFGLDKVSSPNAAFDTYRNVRKGTQLTIIGQDREWLKVDMGNGKIAYVLEDMTTR